MAKSVKGKAVSKPAVKPVAKATISPAQAFSATVLPVLLGVATIKETQSKTTGNARETIRVALVALRDALPDFVAYAAAVVELLGNGEKGKAHKAGSIIEAIPEAQRLSMRVTVSDARKVARWIEDPQHLETTRGQTFTESLDAYKEANPPKSPNVGTAPDGSAKQAGEAVSLEQMIARDVVAAMQIIAKILNGDKRTKVQAATCAALACQIAL